MTKRLRVAGPSDAASTVRATRLCDDIVIEQRSWGLRLKSGPAFIDISPTQWVEAVAAVEVVDVPTPGARLQAEMERMDFDVSYNGMTPDAWEAAAARLGITEGE
jgi:hypothetical protein